MLLELQNVYKTFGEKEGKVEVLKGVSLGVNKGEMIAVMGKSGSGKSTLMNIIGGLMKYDKGEYLYNGSSLDFKNSAVLNNHRKNNIGFVVQYFALINDMNVYNNIALPLRYQKVKRSDIKCRVNDVLQQLGIADKAKVYPNQLSGGQQQRVAIARAIVKEPELILADEPTGALDESTGNDVMKIFRQLNETGKTIIIVTHDQKVADNCDRIIHIKDGMIV